MQQVQCTLAQHTVRKCQRHSSLNIPRSILKEPETTGPPQHLSDLITAARLELFDTERLRTSLPDLAMTQNNQTTLALPSTLSPDSLDVLTQLYTILTEVRTTLQTSAGLDPTTSDDKKTTTPTGLSFKDVVRASDGLRHKLQRGREQVGKLPDMHRSVAEQEAEIKELEARIEKQRLLLARLREGGLQFAQDGGERMEM
jgi:RNA polymerase II transcription mediator complex subunit 9